MTPEQLRTVNAIRYLRDTEGAVRYRQLAEYLGLSASAAHDRVAALVEAGIVEVTPGAAGSIRLSSDGEAGAGPIVVRLEIDPVSRQVLSAQTLEA